MAYVMRGLIAAAWDRNAGNELTCPDCGTYHMRFTGGELPYGDGLWQCDSCGFELNEDMLDTALEYEEIWNYDGEASDEELGFEPSDWFIPPKQ